MTKFSFIAVLLLSSTSLSSQSIGINNNAPHSSAILDIKSNTKGLLIPRTSTTSRNAILNPAKGLLLYDTTAAGFWFHNGTAWAPLAGSSSGWSLTGNSIAANDFIGSTNNQPLRFRVNNTWAGEIHPTTANLFLGLGAGNINTTGQANTAIGEHSLFAITDGNFNTAYGYYSLAANTSGFNNTAFGTYALTSTTTGSHNTAVGRNALFANTTGDFNTATGEGALLTNNTGFNNTANGYQTMFNNTLGDNNTANGYQTLLNNTNGSNNTAMGSYALKDNASGALNVAVGVGALSFNTIADENTAIGSYALASNNGSSNTAIGSNALRFNLNGTNNTAIGKSALNSNNGAYNTAIGNEALLSNTTALSNTAGGYRALTNNTTGSYNTANGVYALSDNTTGASNVAYGAGALSSNTTGSSNIALGGNALMNNIGGNFNIAIGDQSGTGGPNAANLSNTIGIGNYFGFLNGASNQAIIGDASMIFIGGKVNWGTVSDARIKNTIKEDVIGLDFILRLRPVTYHISNNAITKLSGNKETPDFPGKYDAEKIKYSGFLAQEVEQAAKAVNYDFSGYDAPKNPEGLYTLKYAEFVVPIVKAMQEQQQQIILLTKENKDLKTRLDKLEKLLLSK